MGRGGLDFLDFRRSLMRRRTTGPIGMNKLSSATFWIVIFLIVILLFMQFSDRETPNVMTWDELYALAQNGKVKESYHRGTKATAIFTW